MIISSKLTVTLPVDKLGHYFTKKHKEKYYLCYNITECDICGITVIDPSKEIINCSNSRRSLIEMELKPRDELPSVSIKSKGKIICNECRKEN